MTRKLGILSGKGGVAKTTTTVNLGAAFNYFGRDVVIVDGNLSTPNLGLHLGAPIVPISLHDVLKGKNHISEAVYLHGSGLKIIPAGLSLNDLVGLAPERLSKVLPSLDGVTDIVVVDGAAGLGREALSVMNAVDDLIIVTNPELPAVTDALKMVKLAENSGVNVLGIVLARTGSDYDLNKRNIEALLEKPILAEIPNDKAIRESLVKKEPVVYSHPKSKSAMAYKKLAADLIGIKFEEKSGSFLTRLFNK